MQNPPDFRFYYLHNFEQAMQWIATRYHDLLDDGERAFIDCFAPLPQPSRALLVRMLMRKGPLFRSSRLQYDEIGCPIAAAGALVALGWLDEQPALTLTELFALFTKGELAAILDLPKSAARKTDQLSALLESEPQPQSLHAWHPSSPERVFGVSIAPLCERLRLLFFGNLHQQWSEFVLADLGIFKYEKVELPDDARGFQCRRDIDDYLYLQQCAERFEQGEPPESFALPSFENAWLESRRAKLHFRMARELERQGEFMRALGIYRACAYPGARARAIRVLERSGDPAAALTLAELAQAAPENDAEHQYLQRVTPRLRRTLRLPRLPSPQRQPAPAELLELVLPAPAAPCPVEFVVRDHLAREEAPVHYVENALINSLFGLLCWRALFAALPGAFFHPFQAAPADLYSADFQHRRQHEFAACLVQLDDGCYLHTIRQNFHDKQGVQSPFVAWGLLDPELLEMALACIPAAHLKQWFLRMLADLRANRTGMPDLVRFWPRERRYQMIEVKGPGDRLQDNQLRWLTFCAAHDMPVCVCHVRWEGAT